MVRRERDTEHRENSPKKQTNQSDEENAVKPLRAVILDIDGTLLESNDAHAHAWVEAMGEYGYSVPFEKVRPLIGMGGDKVLPETLGIEKDSEQGKRISQRRGEIFKARYLPQVKPFPQAQDLLQCMHDHSLTLVVASSAEPDELKAMLQLIGPRVSDLIGQQASSKDAKQSKPDPDVIHAALERIGYSASEVVMLGDTPYDIQAAAKANVATIALRCGGWTDSDLAGALAVYNDPSDLLAHYET
ncbi:MAG: HAD family hydrolase, partial [Chloroflexi bacterium]|nr:HAD family hydrolase [Chloroflexota bacterium]